MKNGPVISLIDDWDRKELLNYINNQQLICPVCGNIVQARLGNQRLWHFAHVSKEGCLHKLENESEYHLQGKKNLYHWFKSQGINVELESYIPKIKQRPDLLAYVENQRYAIEFQCSTIDSDTLMKRTISYKRENITPIWIMGGNRLKKSSLDIIRPSSFDLLMSHPTNTSDIRLIYYCPATNRFFIASSLLPFSPNTYLAITNFYLPTQLSFSTIIKTSKDAKIINYDTWLTLKKRWRINTFLYTEDSYKRWFYEKGVPLGLLPGEAGVPIKSMIWIKTDAILWQGWILLKFILPLKLGKVISFYDVYHSFKNEVQKGNFRIRYLPILKNSHYSYAIMDYLQQLVRVGVLIQSGTSVTFRKEKDLIIPNNVEAACKQDRDVLQRLKSPLLG